MVDIYLEGAEVHAGALEEEQEAALILNAVLSGKTTPADGCICPDKRDSTIGKGITMRFCDGTGVAITPTLDVEGNPELEICCGIGDFDQEELDETVYYEVTLQSKPVLRSYIAAAYRLCNELTDSESLCRWGMTGIGGAFVCCRHWKRWMHWPITMKRRQRKSLEIIWMPISPL